MAAVASAARSLRSLVAPRLHPSLAACATAADATVGASADPLVAATAPTVAAPADPAVAGTPAADSTTAAVVAAPVADPTAVVPAHATHTAVVVAAPTPVAVPTNVDLVVVACQHNRRL